MGLIQRLLGIGAEAQRVGGAVETVAEVFTVNKTKAELATKAQAMASLKQYQAEFGSTRNGWFPRFINGINRLPRPIMALGTVGLFVFAMADPEGFTTRMRGLAFVPDPLWWLLGAIVSFYFGARELHYARAATPPAVLPVSMVADNSPREPTAVPVAATQFPDNAALAEWVALGNKAA